MKDRKMKLTAKMLRKEKACPDQVAVFEEEWPDGATITKKNCLRAVELGLDIGWFVRRFLTAPAWEAYDKATAPAVEAHDKAMATAVEAHDKAMAVAFYEAATLKLNL